MISRVRSKNITRRGEDGFEAFHERTERRGGELGRGRVDLVVEVVFSCGHVFFREGVGFSSKFVKVHTFGVGADGITKKVRTIFGGSKRRSNRSPLNPKAINTLNGEKSILLSIERNVSGVRRPIGVPHIVGS